MVFFVAFHSAASPDGPNAFSALNAELDRMHEQGPTVTMADLAGYPGPSLVMVGDNEDEIPIEHTLGFRAGLPQSQLAIAPGTGHGLLMEKPTCATRSSSSSSPRRSRRLEASDDRPGLDGVVRIGDAEVYADYIRATGSPTTGTPPATAAPGCCNAARVTAPSSLPCLCGTQ